MITTDQLGPPPSGIPTGGAGSSDDTALTSARQSRLPLSQRMVGPLLGIAGLVVVCVLLASGSFVSPLFEDVLIFAIAAMGIDLLSGFGGLVSLGQAGFVGVGAYGVAIAELHGYSAGAAVCLTLAVVLALALVTGVVAVRASGVAFLIATLALGQIVWGLASRWADVTGGPTGIALNSEPSIGPWNLASTMTLRITTLVVFVGILVALLLLTRSGFGRTLQAAALRELPSGDEPRPPVGSPTGRHRYVAFVIASFVAGIAGVLFVLANHLVSPAPLTFSQDALLVLMVILGGTGTIWGPCLGAVIVVMFQQDISLYVDQQVAWLGVIVVAAVIVALGGVAGLLRTGGPAVNRLLGAFRRLIVAVRHAPPAARAPVPAVASASAGKGDSGNMGAMGAGASGAEGMASAQVGWPR